MKNPYEVLGVSPGASKDDCRKAYRKLSRLYHPDSPSGDQKRFIEIKEAWEFIESGKKMVQAVKRTGLRHKTLFTFESVSLA